MGEFEIIDRYFRSRAADDAVRLGVGDDGAVVSPAAGRELICVVDTLVAGVHYPDGTAAEDIGFRAVAVNLSDIAAMGGRPRWMTLALTLAAVDEQWLDGFSRGLYDAARPFGVSLIGGDTTRGAQTVISVQLLGDVEAGAFLGRGGASAGDYLFVTGTPGDAAGGLALLTRPVPDAAGGEADRRFLRQRFLRPAARVAFGRALAGIATAAIDVSDGLVADAGKLLAASGAGGRLETERLPLSAELRRVFGDRQAAQFCLGGGDDYELCFSARPEREAELLSAASNAGLRLTRIGTVTEGSKLLCVRNGEPIPFADQGYRHF